MADKPKEYSEDIQKALKSIVDDFENEEPATRERQIRLYKKLEYYWSGFQRLHWNETAHDWQAWNENLNSSVSLNEAAYYDKPINVFRAYLESIIAALSATVPGIKCIPDDADNPLDVTTAKGGDKIAELVRKHNDAQLLWCRALFIYCTQGMIAAYTYSDTDDAYGSVDINNYEDFEEERTTQICPLCKMELTDDPIENALHEQDADEFKPDDEDIVRNDLEQQGTLCLNCQKIVNPEIQNQTFIVTRLTGQTKQAKTRQIIDVNGGLFVRVPNYVRSQKETPYVSYCYETHFTNVFKKYPNLRKTANIRSLKSTGAGGQEQYERWGRLNVQYLNEMPLNTPTVRNWWLRSSTFEYIDDDTLREELYKEFPNGCKVVFINDVFADACNQNLDDCWTLTYNPLSEYLTFDPLGTLVVSVQDITNDLVSLTLQTIEHGIPQTFADPATLNFKQYSETEATPGMIFPARSKTGSNLGDGFHSLQTASLGREVEPFADRINEMGQFVSGALPSLFGGAMPSSARTASQYSMSRNQALQRLQTPWKMINVWWKQIFSKVIPAYMKTMIADEKLVRAKHGSFTNDVIKRAELEGKIGDIELESTDELPQTWAQIRDVVMQLIETQNSEILSMIGSPENLEILRQAIGLTQFKIPGESSREKQYREIQVLLQSGPMPIAMGPNGQTITGPTVEPEMLVDDHPVEIAICQDWLRSDEGQLAKIENRPGYDNVTAHLVAHMDQNLQMQMMMGSGMGQPESNPQQAPQQEETNV